MRLGRFRHHRRLFDAFDALGLTDGEVQDFCCWEGTKWARERFEKDEGIRVHDTTGDEIGPYVDRRELREAEAYRRRSITRKTDISVVVEDADGPGAMLGQHAYTIDELAETDDEDEEMSVAESEEEDEDEDDDANTNISSPETETETDPDPEPPLETAARMSHITALNRRREHAIHQRILAAWEQGQSLPPEIEQYLKEQSERGNLEVAVNLQTLVRARRLPPPHNHDNDGSTTGRRAASALVGRAPA